MALRVFNIYERFPYLDLPMHFFGGVVMAFFFHRVSINASLLGITRRYQALRHRLFVFTSTCMAAVSWEFSEFLIDYFAGKRPEGLNDTIGDLFFGIIGCLFFIISASRSRPTYLISRSP
jgi:hypothetical protein